MQDPQPEFQPQHGAVVEVAPAVRRIVAPNPSPMTFRGTNTYLLGTDQIAVVDPGPDMASHLDAIEAAISNGGRITHILVTHAHVDHSALAPRLSARTGAPIYAYGDALAGRSPLMQTLAAMDRLGGGEGVDAAFTPDICLTHAEQIDLGGLRITAHYTPGHMANHLAFSLGDVLLSGDLVMGWATSLVSPPDGDLTAFMDSLRQLQSNRWSQFLPGHGAPISDPDARLQELLDHRMGREASVLQCLAKAPATAEEIAKAVYTQTPAALIPAATRNVLAHLIDLTERGLARPDGPISPDARFSTVA
ncbi:MBL fold metallo-hydrolase [Sagittula sp. SSi028]|uniref:MBL fold metallo-hydrolase n=1 Tax=Sagittula sp. SSi028 TaxID=3400636 RepID=UPI003AF43D95